MIMRLLGALYLMYEFCTIQIVQMGFLQIYFELLHYESIIFKRNDKRRTSLNSLLIDNSAIVVRYRLLCVIQVCGLHLTMVLFVYTMLYIL